MGINITAFMTMGRGDKFDKPSKEKLSTDISTKAELVGVNDFLMQVVCTRYFQEAQGYKIHSGIIYQDNSSDINLENNRRQPRSKQTKHISIRNYFITNRLDKQEAST